MSTAQSTTRTTSPVEMAIEHGVARTLLHTAPLGIVVTDIHDTIVWANNRFADLVGDGRPPLVGSRLSALVAPAALESKERAERELVASGGPSYEQHEQWLAADGSTQWFAVTASLVADEQGRPMLAGDPPAPLILRQLMDVTERRMAQDALRDAHRAVQKRNRELERSNQDLTEFAYVASHDLSEPLRVIAGHVELLARRYEGRLDDDADRYIAFAVDGCARLRTLIDDLLRFSRAGRHLDRETIDVERLVGDVLEDVAELMRQHDASLLVDGPLPYVEADPTQLRQVLTNLLANAVRFGRPGHPPRVTLSAVVADGLPTFTISDNGVGVPVHQYEKVFRIFQRLHSREVPGTGIGLAICRKVVEAHGGVIWIEPNEPHGSMFRFTLPSAPMETSV